MKHFGDPCIHCAIPHDEVAIGPCQGNPAKAIPVQYRSLGVRWDHVEHFLVMFSDGHTQDRWHHIGEQAPYWHFGYSRELRHPPMYNERLRRSVTEGQA